MTIEIKSGKLIASVVFILAGFSAGVGLSLLPNSATVHGASGQPNLLLNGTVHDETLVGDGNSSSPLGIADGGVSAPKLSAAAPPTLGQILGFNGANLAWQKAPVNGARVVDSLGHDVGPFQGGSALLRIAGSIFDINVSQNGFESAVIVFAHQTADCSGPRYVIQTGHSFIRDSSLVGSFLVYPADPLVPITINTEEVVAANADLRQFGHCELIDPTQAYVGLPAVFDISTLGFVPPFRLEF